MEHNTAHLAAILEEQLAPSVLFPSS